MWSHGGVDQVHVTSQSRETNPNPTTETSDSMTDQVLNVCGTVILKLWLTSQNPASLTCDRNSEPVPTASASRARCGELNPVASGAMIPAAVVVATVAEPVASRIATASR